MITSTELQNYDDLSAAAQATAILAVHETLYNDDEYINEIVEDAYFEALGVPAANRPHIALELDWSNDRDEHADLHINCTLTTDDLPGYAWPAYADHLLTEPDHLLTDPDRCGITWCDEDGDWLSGECGNMAADAIERHIASALTAAFAKAVEYDSWAAGDERARDEIADMGYRFFNDGTLFGG